MQGIGADGLKLALALLHERRAGCPGKVPILAVHGIHLCSSDFFCA